MRFRCVFEGVLGAFFAKFAKSKKVCVERIDFAASRKKSIKKKKGQRESLCRKNREFLAEVHLFFLVILLFLPNLSADLARPYGSLRHTLARRRRAILLGTQKT